MEGGTGASTAPELVSRMALNDNKAGMEGLDKERINKVILDISKGSRFYENELKKEQQVNHKIEKMLQQKAQHTDQQIRQAELEMDGLVAHLEESRDLSRTIVHVDMDMFYAAVEMRDRPELKDKPMAVGSMSMLSTSNYHARRFGVRAAMPGFIAKKLCPDLVVCPLNFDKYSAVSKQVREILADYDPNFLPLSLDEAYLDITAHLEERQAWPESHRTFAAHQGLCQGRDCDECRLAVTGSVPHNACDENSLKVLGNGATECARDDPDVPARGFTTGKETDETKDGASLENCSPELFDSTPPQTSGSETAALGSGASASCIGAPGRSLAAAAAVFGLSVDEAVREMRFRIEQKTGLTASAGIAPNMMLAKVGSDMNKPNGQYRVMPTRDAVRLFVDELPIRKVNGIGKVTEKMLNALGVLTCAHLHRQRALLALLFSEGSCRHFLRISMGLGSTHLDRDGERKSMSTERTFSEINKPEELYSLCSELCGDLASDLSKEGLKGRTVTVKTKSVSFEVKTRAVSLPAPIASREEIYAAAKELLKTEMDTISPQPLRLRLMGVRLSGFVSRAEQKQRQQSISAFVQSTSREAAASHAEPGPCCPAPGEPVVSLAEQVEGCSRHSNPKTIRLKETHHPLNEPSAPGSAAGAVPGPEQDAGLPDVRIKSFFQRIQAERQSQLVKQPSAAAPSLASKPHGPCVGTTGQPSPALTTDLGGGRSTQCGEDAAPVYTCPVCDVHQYSGSLAEFNAHIDECLHKTERLGVDPPGSSSDGTGCGRGFEEEQRRTRTASLAKEGDGELRQSTCAASAVEQVLHGGVEKCAKQRSPTNELACLSEESERTRTGKYPLNHGESESRRIESWDSDSTAVRPADALGECVIPWQRAGGGGSPVEHPGDREEASAATGTSASAAAAAAATLTCPICLCPQDSSDLVAFNSHVDICLNTRVIKELTGHSQGSAEARKQQNSSSGRLKRPQANSKKPAAKRTKPSPSKAGIERFFR